MSGIVISSLLKWKWKHLLARDIVIVPSGDCLEGILVFAEVWVEGGMGWMISLTPNPWQKLFSSNAG